MRYWAMLPLRGAFTPHDEVDEARWVSLGAAAGLLTYRRDHEILQAFARGEPR